MIIKDSKEILKLNFQYLIREQEKNHYGLRLLRNSKITEGELSNSISKNYKKLLKIIGLIIKTLKNPNS